MRNLTIIFSCHSLIIEKLKQHIFFCFSAIREEMNSSTGRVFVVVVEASDLTTPKEKRGKKFHNLKNTFSVIFAFLNAAFVRCQIF